MRDTQLGMEVSKPNHLGVYTATYTESQRAMNRCGINQTMEGYGTSEREALLDLELRYENLRAYNLLTLQDNLFKVVDEHIILNSKFHVIELGRAVFSLIFKADSGDLTVTVFGLNDIETLTLVPARIAFTDRREEYMYLNA